jgi:hypothetical protein
MRAGPHNPKVAGSNPAPAIEKGPAKQALCCGLGRPQPYPVGSIASCQDFDPPDEGPDRGQWQVHISLPPSEIGAVRRFASQVLPAENFEIHTELGESREEGEIVFAVRVMAETAEDATAEAAFKLNKIRRMAELPSGPVAVLGYISPQWRRDPARHLGREATELLKQGRDALAVVRTQTACELLIAETLEELLATKFPDVRADNLIRRPATLADKTSLALCQLLSGRRIQDETWWPQYLEHRKRRNSIVHEGVSISHEDAQASIAAMNDLHGWLVDARETAFAAEQGGAAQATDGA